MSSEQVDCNGPRTISHILIPFLKHDIQFHKGYWLAASQASIQSLYTSTGSDRSEEQWIKDKNNFVSCRIIGASEINTGKKKKKKWMTAGKYRVYFAEGEQWVKTSSIIMTGIMLQGVMTVIFTWSMCGTWSHDDRVVGNHLPPSMLEDVLWRHMWLTSLIPLQLQPTTEHCVKQMKTKQKSTTSEHPSKASHYISEQLVDKWRTIKEAIHISQKEKPI